MWIGARIASASRSSIRDGIKPRSEAIFLGLTSHGISLPRLQISMDLKHAFTLTTHFRDAPSH
ncbi:hypothetical protein RMSM_06000 [Rhodopirellula maiorica SM1]|uniref:Uncharacterized protein n=1 Tax=Rhodopirellula maiorica SM1 TaxID=1265738 RepID=M5RDD3_9BACT|nr:hypothetical protein RMSM_06000 [Rhodopirellula maiorica SM1]